MSQEITALLSHSFACLFIHRHALSFIILQEHVVARSPLTATLCYMELREGDVAENQNIRSSREAAEYSLTFEIVLPGGRVQFCFSNSPAVRGHPAGLF